MSEPSNYLPPEALGALAGVLEVPIDPFHADKLGASALQALGVVEVQISGGQQVAYKALPVARLYDAIKTRARDAREAAEQIVDVVHHGGVVQLPFGDVGQFIAQAQAPNQDPASQLHADLALRTFAGSAVLAGLLHTNNVLTGSAALRDFEAALADRGIYNSDEGGVDRDIMLEIGSVLQSHASSQDADSDAP